MLAGLSGCTRSCNFQFGAVTNSTSRELFGSYVLLSGTKDKVITVEESEPVIVTADIVTKKGTLNVAIVNDTDEPIFQETDLGTKTFTVDLDKPGKYTIKIKADGFKGSYSFKW